MLLHSSCSFLSYLLSYAYFNILNFIDCFLYHQMAYLATLCALVESERVQEFGEET